MTTQSYSYIKSSPLSEKEKQRLRVSIASELRLKHKIQHPSRNALVNLIITLYDNPLLESHQEVMDWLLSYGRPGLVRIFANALSQLEPAQTELKILKEAQMEHMLAKEYIYPDLQSSQSVPNPKSALICFTGGSHRLNFSVQLFHFLAARRFDLIFYLRDFTRQCFTQGIPGIADNIDDLSICLREKIPSDCPISVLGTSAGGYAAAALSEAISIHRLALFSPAFYFEDKPAIKTYRLHPQNVRMYFGSTNAQDLRFANSWSYTNYVSAIRWLPTGTHGTLKYLLVQDQLQTLFGWMLENQATTLQGFH